MGVFDYDGGLMRSICKFADCIFLSLLFVVSCIPVFTIGTAAAAMYHAANKVLRHDRGYVFRDYVETFQENFRQTAPVWLITLAAAIVLGADWYVAVFYVKEGLLCNILTALFIAGIVVLSVWMSYLFPYMARFQNTRRQSMKNAALMALAHFPTTILMLIVFAATVAILCALPPLLAILPAFYSWIQGYILERVFRKYMSEEDRRREDELNYGVEQEAS